MYKDVGIEATACAHSADTVRYDSIKSSDCNVSIIGLELSEAYNLVDRYIVSKWQHFWDQEVTGSH